MQTKREKLVHAFERNPILACNVCGKPLSRGGMGFSCANGHARDINKKGSLNFLSSKEESCYDAELFASRERVFQSGHYQSVLDAVDALIGNKTKVSLLDAGCGEGWYTDSLLQRHPDWCAAGVDISREAIAAATNRSCEALWCVADLRCLPFMDDSFDVVLDVLTPANYAEFKRVLKPSGILIKVFPGEMYLREIREARGIPLYKEGQVDNYLRQRTAFVGECHVLRTLPVDPLQWHDFVWMTPLNQDLTSDEKQKLAENSPGRITIDLHVAAVRL